MTARDHVTKAAGRGAHPSTVEETTAPHAVRPVDQASRRLRGAAWLVAAFLGGCEAATSDAVADAAVVTDTSAPDAAPAADTPNDDLGPVADVAEPPEDTTSPALGPLTLAVSQPCCVSLSATRLVFQDAAGLHLVDADGVRPLDAPADTTAPLLAGDAILLERGAAPERSLWRLDPASGTLAPWRAGHDAHDAASDGRRVVWIEGSGVTAEVWTALADAPGDAVRLTSDDAEQLWPHVEGDHVVWTDFRNDPDHAYVGQPSSPTAGLDNNGDIYALDLVDGAPLSSAVQLTEDPAKQARPAVEGEVVAWLDWRGISPEPKYSRFGVWARRRDGPEIALGEGNWEKPAFWARPAVSGDTVSWTRDLLSGARLEQQRLDGGLMTLAQVDDGGVGVVVTTPGLLAWATATSLEVRTAP